MQSVKTYNINFTKDLTITSLVFGDFSKIWSTDSDRRRLICNQIFSSIVEHGDLIDYIFHN